MRFTETCLRGAFVIDLQPLADERGAFTRTFCARELEARGLNPAVAQENVSATRRRGAIRGFHFQYPPDAETKVVRCSRGGMLSVIVDLRPESDTYLQHAAIELRRDNHRALYVPERFAHGFQALEDETETCYLMGAFYRSDAAGGLHYSDPRLGLEWPVPVTDVSERDRAWPLLDEVEPRVRDRMRLR